MSIAPISSIAGCAKDSKVLTVFLQMKDPSVSPSIVREPWFWVNVWDHPYFVPGNMFEIWGAGDAWYVEMKLSYKDGALVHWRVVREHVWNADGMVAASDDHLVVKYNPGKQIWNIKDSIADRNVKEGFKSKEEAYEALAALKATKKAVASLGLSKTTV